MVFGHFHLGTLLSPLFHCDPAKMALAVSMIIPLLGLPALPPHKIPDVPKQIFPLSDSPSSKKLHMFNAS
ncbi:hypothetical protein PCANC_19317 [Puccinia coronata f. sp. avenae]|uniref:Uncharacterized protein n=1 Tax=Puccinia coronata f. sp. avenae TaxID=200324 RepID=A0A2N5UM92_9BASI|nr:hypothetical protein PCANC_19317 [Puccinia coronata f. sp. avenae]